MEVLTEVRDARTLRNGAVALAAVLQEGWARPEPRVDGPTAQPGAEVVGRALLVLDRPRISGARLRAEWQRVTDLLRPDLAHRLSYVVVMEGRVVDASEEFAGTRPVADVSDLLVLVRREAERHPGRRRTTAAHVVLRNLLLRWFRREGPITLKRLGEVTGYTYPTIARVTQDLGSHIARQSDRRVALRSFPEGAWRKLRADSDTFRETRYYRDASRFPRSPQVLLERARTWNAPNVAIGGIVGATFYHPGIDLVGVPRIDLTLHNPDSQQVANLPRRLDPGLEPTRRGEHAQLAIHVLNQPVPTFLRDASGAQYADEVDCVLDLLDAGFESPGQQFLDFEKEHAES